MPGWTTGDNWHNNIAYTPGTWIALHRICEKHGVGDQFRIHYDPSHAILMGQDTRSIFQYLKDSRLQLPDRRLPREGPGRRREGRRRRGATAARRSSAATGSNGKPSDEPGRSAERVEEAGRARRARAAGHGAARSARLPAEPHRRLARSPARRARAAAARRRQHAPRRRARVPAGAHPGPERLKPILQGSIAFVRHIDEAAACMYALQHEVLAGAGHPGAGHRAARRIRS